MDSTGSIECKICQEWFHSQCQGVVNAKGMMMKAIKELWFCEGCKKAIPDFRKLVKEGNLEDSRKVASEIEKLGKQMQDLEQKIKNGWKTVNQETVSKCDELEEKVGKVLDKVEASVQQNAEMMASFKGSVGESEARQASYADVVKKVVGEKMDTFTHQVRPPVLEQKMVQECIDKENRKCNIVVTNLREPQGTGLGNRSAADKQAVYDMFHQLHLEVDVGKVVRLGAKPDNGRPRLLLVATQSEEVKWDVIRAARGLREIDEYVNVLINPDMTRMERETQSKLRAEVRERKERGEDVYIAKGKVMTRRSQHRGTGQGQAAHAPAGVERGTPPLPATQGQINNEVTAQDQAAVTVAEEIEVAPNVQQASTPAEVQEEQVVDNAEGHEGVEVAGALEEEAATPNAEN